MRLSLEAATWWHSVSVDCCQGWGAVRSDHSDMEDICVISFPCDQNKLHCDLRRPLLSYVLPPSLKWLWEIKTIIMRRKMKQLYFMVLSLPIIISLKIDHDERTPRETSNGKIFQYIFTVLRIFPRWIGVQLSVGPRWLCLLLSTLLISSLTKLNQDPQIPHPCPCIPQQSSLWVNIYTKIQTSNNV